jgi:hypothetical protein
MPQQTATVTLLTPAVLATTALAWGLVHAQAPAPAAPPDAVAAAFQRLDSDGDARISRQEAKSMPVVEAHFDAADRSGDGLLTLEEFRAAFEPDR